MLRGFLLNLQSWTWTLLNMERLRRRPPRPFWARPGRLLLGAGTAIVVIVLAMMFADAVTISHQRNLPHWIYRVFDDVTDFGRSHWVLLPTGGLVLLIAAVALPPLARMQQLVLVSVATRLGFIFASVAVPGLVVTILKRLIGRTRPYNWEKVGAFDFSPWRWNSEFASLPSGHGTTAFATAFAIGALYPRLRLPMWLFAAVIAISRVAVSAHYPSDVLAGAVVGTFGALAVRNWFAARHLAFVPAPDGTVHALPGPSWRRVGTAAAAAYRARR